MSSGIGLIWFILFFVIIGLFFIFFAAGEKLTPKKSILTGKVRTKDEISSKGFVKGILLFVLFILIVGSLTD